MRTNDHKPNGSMEDLKCMGAGRERSAACDECQRARGKTTGAPTE